MNTSDGHIPPQQVRDSAPGWSPVGKTITATFLTGDFATGVEFINLIGASAEEADHHPDVELTYAAVKLTLTSHDIGEITQRDLRLAAKINEHATSLGLTMET